MKGTSALSGAPPCLAARASFFRVLVVTPGPQRATTRTRSLSTTSLSGARVPSQVTSVPGGERFSSARAERGEAPPVALCTSTSVKPFGVGI